MSATRHLLTLTACLLLALPTGWCCLFPLDHTPAAKADPACCKSCCSEPKPQGEEAPAREPMAWCCCENFVSMRDDSAAKAAPDAAVMSFFVAERPATTEPFLNRAATLCLSPPRPLHVLRCLWLC